MDATLKKMLRLLDNNHTADVRVAALVVLGELHARDKAVLQHVADHLHDEDEAIRKHAIRTAGLLRHEKAIPQLLDIVKKGGEDATEAAAAVAHIGPKGTKALQETMHHVPPGLRRSIAAALGTGHTASAETAAVDALLDTDPGVVEAATRSLVASIAELSASHRKGLVDHLLELLTDKKRRLPLVSEAAFVRLLAALDDVRAEKACWDRVHMGHPNEVRAAALHALGRWLSAPKKLQFQRLIVCACDDDFQVAAPAAVLLKKIDVGRHTDAWMPLFGAADVAVRRFAVDKLGDSDKKAVVDALAKQLGHPDGALRESALAKLAQHDTGRDALTDVLFQETQYDRAMMLAKAQSPFVQDYPASLRQRIMKKAFALLEADDRRAEALLFLLHEADEAKLRERMGKRALELRKKKKYADAIRYLRYLVREPACDVNLRFELACCGLKESPHDLEARHGDPCLQQFNRLTANYADELLSYIQKAKWLEAGDLHYVGFHCAEQNGAARSFGGDVLRETVKRSPRSKIAKDAKTKLQLEGLD